MSSVVRERRKKVGKKTVKSYEVIENNGTPEGQVHATCDKSSVGWDHIDAAQPLLQSPEGPLRSSLRRGDHHCRGR